jgi:death-on-curing protein
MKSIRFLSTQEIIAINVAVIQKYSQGEHIGVKSQSLLESAVLRPQSSAFSEDAYPSLFAKGASLFESLGQNYPFQNANKRTAFTALAIFMQYNGLSLKMESKFAEDFTVNMVKHKYTLKQIIEIIYQYSIEK